MPKRKLSPPQARIVFTAPRTVATGPGHRKSNTSAARRHAAYWGCPTSKEDRNPADEHHRCDSEDHVEATAARHAFNRLRQRRFTSLSGMSMLEIVTNCNEMCGTFTADSLFGKKFLEQMSDPCFSGESLMTSGYVLVTMAYSMAVTGKGDVAVFLSLKEYLLRSVREMIQRGRGRSSLQCMGLMLLLGSPIVCLLSRCMPGGLAVAQYLAASAADSSLCCTKSASTAKEALAEKHVHWRSLSQAMEQEGRTVDESLQHDWFRYMLRFLEITTHLDKDTCIDVPPPTSQLLLKINVQEFDDDKSSVRVWMSPMTTWWLDQQARTCLETPERALGRMLWSWVATFLLEDGQPCPVTSEVLEKRQCLRREIEHFIGVKIQVKNAQTAMLACCQWAATIMLKVDRYRMSISDAAFDTPIKPRLVTCLRMTDLSSLWDSNRGMLFWVVTICHRATAGRCFPLLSSALLARFAHESALSEHYHNVALIPLSRLDTFESLSCA